MVAIGVLPGDAPEHLVGVVISHDCDLATDNLTLEPTVEFIVGSDQPRPDGNFTWAKSTRTLQLEVMKSGEKGLVELGANRKHAVDKKVLAEYDPDSRYALEPRHLAALRDWLAARYNRTAFPDEFNARLEALGAPEKIKKLLASSSDLVSFVYFDLKGRERDELPKGLPYELSVVLVHFPGPDPDEAAAKAEALAERVDAALRQRLEGSESGIKFRGCFAISEDDIQLGQAQLL